MNHSRLLSFGGLALVLLVPSCDGSLGRSRTVGLRVGYAVEAPYAWVASDGRVTGESPEVLRVVASRLGIDTLVWRQLEFSRLADELREGKIDVVASGWFITAERRALVRFSRPTVRVREAFLVRRDNPRAPRTLEPRPGASLVTVVAGAYEESLLEGYGWSADALFRVPDALTGLRTVEQRRGDALMLSAPTLRSMARGRDDLEVVVPEGLPGELAAFAFRPEDAELVAAWDQVLATYLGTAEHLALVEPLGFGPGDLP